MRSYKQQQGEIRKLSSVVNAKKKRKSNRMRKTRDLVKKIRNTIGTFNAKIGTIKDRNGMDLTEAKDIKKRWQEHTEELYTQDLNDPDSHDGVIGHQEPDILECEVKWALGSITRNKASGGDRIPTELFKILNDGLLKCCTQYPHKFEKLSSGHRTGKGQFSLQSQRRAVLKNVQTPKQMHSFYTLAR